MNRIHRWLCRSAAWKRTLEQRIPWVLGGANLGQNVLEIGPGPGLTTDLLRSNVARIIALEIDPALARLLQARSRDSNVRVVRGDATLMPFQNAQFSGAVSFTMLHHVPSKELQDKLLREVRRVLMPGAIFAGMDSLQSFSMRIIHVWDTLVPVNPKTFCSRLQAAGFHDVSLEIGAQCFRFCARVPL
jgi:ubiquinone/menaquinone biosynthesis C-methylase UbiE